MALICNLPARLAFLALFSTLLLPAPAFALDPSKAITQYGHDLWLRQNGLPANAVNVALQTRDGYLWLGTAAGLYRFDGVRFSRVSTDPQDNENRETVAALFEASDGSLWIGTAYNWLGRIKDGTIIRYGEPQGITSRNVNAVMEGRDGKIWLGTSYGLYRSTENKFEWIPVDQTYITDVVRDSSGRVWVSTHAGIDIFENNHNVGRIRIHIGAADQMVTTMYVDRQGSVWVGTYGGLARWSAGSVTTYTQGDGLTDSHITAIHQDRDGNIWVGTNSGGLNRLSEGRWTSFTTKNGLTNDHVISITEDHEGSLWICTLEGLNRLKDVDVTTFTTQEGLANDYVSSVAQTSDGSMFFLSDQSSTITRLREGKSTVTRTAVGPAYVARDGSLWIGQTGELLNVRGDHITRYDTTNGMPPNWITAISEDRESLVMFVDGLGLRRFVNGRVEPYLLADGQPYASTEYEGCYYDDPDGTFWIGTSRGLVRIKDGKSVVFTPKDGMADLFVGSIFADGKGSLWIGSPRGGLTRYHEGKFTAYSTKIGLFTNEIFCVLGDDQDNLWLSSPRGIGMVSRQDLDDYEAGRISAIHTRVFMTTDGMKTDECFGGWQPAGCTSSDGRLWFATKKGAVVIDPDALRKNPIPPPVLIEEIIADQQHLAPGDGIQLPPGKEKFEFHYTALSFLAPERVLFKYKLEGYDREWVDAGTRRAAFFTGLPPGEYRFRVVACNNDGVWNETGASVEMILAPHYYQSYWFYGVCVVALALVILGLHRLRVRSLMDRERQLESLVQARTNELQQQRTLLQDQRSFLRKIIDLNPSFIFAKDREGRFTLANRALAWAYGANADMLIGKTDADFNARLDEVEKFRGDDLQVMNSNTEKFIPAEEFTDSDGKQHWMQVIKIPITSDDGTANQMLGVATDITERKQAEERLKASLHEKEVLLKEIHHRVKNNLQVVSSLLNLQAGQMKDEESRMALSECKLRVRSMALIHENLYRSENLANINFGDYLGAVTNELVRSFGKAGISASFDLDPLFLPIDIAIPCGLIVNELVTNALRHAFPEGATGLVSISLHPKEETSAVLTVHDNGVGFPEGLDIRSLKSMGMNLVVSLSDQIGGTITLERSQGTTFRLVFPTKPA